jgi:hypothetical protein
MRVTIEPHWVAEGQPLQRFDYDQVIYDWLLRVIRTALKDRRHSGSFSLADIHGRHPALQLEPSRSVSAIVRIDRLVRRYGEELLDNFLHLAVSRKDLIVSDATKGLYLFPDSTNGEQASASMPEFDLDKEGSAGSDQLQEEDVDQEPEDVVIPEDLFD